MELMNLLADVPISLLGETFDISLNWIGRFVKLIISSGLGVGLGVILFSLILKVIVLPFDIMQRISMRKQNLKMKENKDKMEKLQKQYANDKQMYNQKVMEMQKQSGFSMLTSCLPMILSMVIFFVAIGAFNAYAKFSTVDNYNTLVNAYKGAVNEYVVDLDAEDTSYTLDNNFIVVEEADKIIYFKVEVTADETATLTTQDAMKEKIKSTPFDKRAHLISQSKAMANAEIAAAIANAENKDDALKEYFYNKGAAAAKTTYNEKIADKTDFLWIKNIWATDATYKHPVLSHEDFLKELAAASCGSSCSSNGTFIIDGQEVSVDGGGALVKDKVTMTNVYEERIYNMVTKDLGEQKEAYNGYYILIVLSIGTILLQQFIMQRSQKEQQKYSSVDGQAASTQKITMIMMTVMFGFFSFMYSSAFSIYMIMSNIFSLASTLIINKCVDAAAHRKEQKALQEKYNKRLPRKESSDKKKSNKKGK